MNIVDEEIRRIARLHDPLHRGETGPALAGAELLAEFAPVGMFWADERGGLLHANRHWVGMLGLPVERALGDGWVNAIHPDDVDALAATWSHAVAAREPCSGRFRVRLPAGEPQRWVRFRASPAACASGISFVGVTADISETMRLQEELMAKNGLLESIIENLPCGVSVFDRHLRHVVSNRQARSKLDLPEDVLDRPDASFQSVARVLARRGEYGPGDVEQIVAGRVAAVRAMQVRERVRADGTVIQVRAGQMPSGGIVITYDDVTAERRAASDLATSQRRLSLALEASALALWEYDLPRRELQFSEGWSGALAIPALKEMLSAEEVGGFLPPAERARLCGLRRQLAAGEIDRIDTEHAVLSTEGRTVCSCTPWRRSPNATPTGSRCAWWARART